MPSSRISRTCTIWYRGVRGGRATWGSTFSSRWEPRRRPARRRSMRCSATGRHLTGPRSAFELEREGEAGGEQGCHPGFTSGGPGIANSSSSARSAGQPSLAVQSCPSVTTWASVQLAPPPGRTLITWDEQFRGHPPEERAWLSPGGCASSSGLCADGLAAAPWATTRRRRCLPEATRGLGYPGSSGFPGSPDAAAC
jgi:hypothetical protein